MNRRPLHVLGVLGIVLFGAAHVGSNDTVFEGAAGPYAVRVIVRTPGVVPGLADITVRILAGAGVEAITALPLRGGRPTALDPPPDTAQAVPGDPRLFTARLWLMEAGAYSIRVNVAGAAGRGTVIVPVNSIATRRLGLGTPLAIGLMALGFILCAGALTVVYAAVSEGTLEPGVPTDPIRRRRAVLAAALAFPIVAIALWGGNRWWNAEDARFQRSIYRPLAITATITPGPDGSTLHIAITDSAWLGRQWTPLIPDHGKLMHLFLIGGGDTPARFAHLHPVMQDSSRFDAALPPLAPGRYRLFADVVHESGFTQTLQDSIVIDSGPATWRPTDPDDSYGAQAATTGDVAHLADGSTMTWLRDSLPAPIVAGRDVELRFAVTGPRDAAADLEPYLGMAAHAAVMRDDGSVFAHLHPLGTISMASQLVYELRQPGDTTPGALARRVAAFEQQGQARMTKMALPDTVRIPYVFPRDGHYRLWVQVRRHGQVLTGAFATDVLAAPSR